MCLTSWSNKRGLHHLSRSPKKSFVEEAHSEVEINHRDIRNIKFGLANIQIHNNLQINTDLRYHLTTFHYCRVHYNRSSEVSQKSYSNRINLFIF